MKYTASDLLIRDIVRDITDTSLYYFCKWILAYPDINERVHKPMLDFYQPPRDSDENSYRLDLEPRNTMKSTFCIVGGIIWLLALDQNSRNLILSSSEDEAKKRLKAIKEKMSSSDLLKYFYLDLAKNSRANTWRQDSIVVYGRTAVDLEPSVDTAGRGTDKTGNHYGGTLDGGWGGIFIDDIENEKTSASEEELSATKRFFRRLSPCMQPKKSMMRLSGTRWSFDDLYSMILGENELDRGTYSFFECRVMSAINPDGSLYYPERLTHRFLEREKKFLGNYLYSANYLNDPASDEDAAFHPLDTVFYAGEYIKQGTAKFIKVDKVVCNGRPGYKYVPHDNTSDLVQVRTYICIDPALSESDQSCYSGIIVAGRDMFENRIWVIDALRIKSQEPLVIINELIRMYFRYEPLSVVIENIAYQQAMKSFFEAECKKQHIYPAVEMVGRSDHRSKHERIIGLSSFWKSHNLMMPLVKDKGDDSNYIRSLCDELYHFPKSRTLDLADALSRVLDVSHNLSSRTVARELQKIEANYAEEWA